MTPEQIGLVRGSWAQVLPMADRAAELFYGRLFEIAPTVRPLFAGTDFVEQRQKLVRTLALAVGSLDRMDAVRHGLEALARRHVEHGVTDAHYAPAGEALVWTLQRALGPGFTPEVRAAWVAAYARIADCMRSAAREAVTA